MNPLLFILALLLYAEGSSCKMTRDVSRVILYTYLLSLVSSIYVPSLNLSLILGLLFSLSSYIYCYTRTPNIYVKTLSVGLSILITIFYLVLLENNLHSYPDIIQKVLSYSNYIYRDITLTLVGIISLRYATTRDNILNFIIGIMWMTEKSITLI